MKNIRSPEIFNCTEESWRVWGDVFMDKGLLTKLEALQYLHKSLVGKGAPRGRGDGTDNDKETPELTRKSVSSRFRKRP